MRRKITMPTAARIEVFFIFVCSDQIERRGRGANPTPIVVIRIGGQNGEAIINGGEDRKRRFAERTLRSGAAFANFVLGHGDLAVAGGAAELGEGVDGGFALA